jgi:hypothetical protein
MIGHPNWIDHNRLPSLRESNNTVILADLLKTVPFHIIPA